MGVGDEVGWGVGGYPGVYLPHIQQRALKEAETILTKRLIVMKTMARNIIKMRNNLSVCGIILSQASSVLTKAHWIEFKL